MRIVSPQRDENQPAADGDQEKNEGDEKIEQFAQHRQQRFIEPLSHITQCAEVPEQQD